MTVRQLVGDCRVQLATLDAGAAQCCITSPPYYGLRSYGTPDLVWGGDANHTHEWGTTVRSPWANSVPGPSDNHPKNGAASHWTPKVSGQFCVCGAWSGSLGLEPDPASYVKHIVECFQHVKRVLSDDGTLWVNLGDSYAGSGNGSNDHRQNGKHFRKGIDSLSLNAEKYQGQKPGNVIGYKPKDLLMIPFRVAMALQADGWWLRSVIPWFKRNSMPESVQDRPSTSVEYVFLLSKSSRYYWDADAVRSGYQPASLERAQYGRDDIRTGTVGHLRDGMQKGVSKNGAPNRTDLIPHASGRNRRNSDWFFESWQGLMLDEQDDPLALVVNPQPFKQSHFATFPPKLVEPMVKASTRPGDVILDPFGGAGTVGLVADRLGRNAVLVDLKPEYSAMAVDRLTGDAPMFVQVNEAPA